ncbi:hypothetical protein CISIN_1g030560mg [Citrus sinensis]|uniref:Checkpoint protein n=1 Tax=Citrus sinensis TaxID=2711 RepID=A0A067EBQ6_CITSI|nr:hypothetical protein CISIN_1g030560mg [Citrus sinensis]
MGKVCHLFLTREKAYFLHNLLSGEGIQCVAQFHRETLFDDYRISSQNEDCIAFAIDISLLQRAVRSSVSICSAEFRKLLVIGEKAVAPSEDRNLSAQTRSERAISRGDAQSVQVSVKHFSKSLQCHLAKPDCAFYGIAPQGACLTVIFQFFIPGTRQTDKSISLHCRLPVLEPGT